MPPSGFRIYLPPRMTLIFALLSHKVDRFMSLPHFANFHQNRFIRSENIVFTSLVTDGRTDERTDR